MARSARVEQKRERAKQEILQVAQQILQAKGVEAVTLASVAGQLGMTKQALYHYFPSKEALLRGLVSTLLDYEIETLLNVVDAPDFGEYSLGKLINAFYEHYVNRLDVFRTVYCQSQLYTAAEPAIDEDTLREDIHPRTRQLFDRLEVRMAGESANDDERRRMRQLAFTAWTSALGLLTMLSIADANQDPLVHSDQELLETLASVFDSA
jgi:AcrR family transcriptional regulator